MLFSTVKLALICDSLILLYKVAQKTSNWQMFFRGDCLLSNFQDGGCLNNNLRHFCFAIVSSREIFFYSA